MDNREDKDAKCQHSKKPENINDMIDLYMEMQVSHRIMELRLQKVENQLLSLGIKV